MAGRSELKSLGYELVAHVIDVYYIDGSEDSMNFDTLEKAMSWLEEVKDGQRRMELYEIWREPKKVYFEEKKLLIKVFEPLVEVKEVKNEE